MHWIIIAYLICLVYLTAKKVTINTFEAIKSAWFFFSLVPLNYASFTLIKAFNHDDMSDLALTIIWQDGLTWLFLAMSFFRLSDMITPLGLQKDTPPTEKK